MKEKEKDKKKEAAQAPEKVKVKVDNIVGAYRLLTTPNNPHAKEKGFSLSELETDDLFRAIHAINALKPVSVAFTDFQKDAQERLKPEGWDEMAERYESLTEEEKLRLNSMTDDYNSKVNQCMQTELEKYREIDAFEHLSKEGFATLVRNNGHLLDSPRVLLLKELIG